MSTTTTIWLVRHGETDWNTGSRVQGTTDIPLNAIGVAQAQLVAKRLATFSLDAIYSSPLSRAMQTAMPLADQLGASVHPVPGLAERDFGSFQGKTPDQVAIDDPLGYQRWQTRDPDFIPTGGESLAQFRDRVAKALDDVIQSRLGQTIAVFTHGGVLDMIYRLANDIALDAPRAWPIANAAIHHLIGAPGLVRINTWGILDHLGGQMGRDELRGIA